jgi:alpha-tubulin suppressor-like RCC1 family protein
MDSLRGIAGLFAFLGCALAGCGGETVTGPSRPARIIAVSGSGQRGMVGQPFPDSLVARVVDERGTPVPDARVEWTVGHGGGSVLASTAATDAAGLVSAQWTFGTVSDNGAVTATVTSWPQLTVDYWGYAAPGPASRLQFSVHPSTTTTGDAIWPPVVVAVQDRFGNVVPGFSGSVTVAIGSNPAGGALTGTSTIAVSSGTATFSDLRIDRAGAAYSLTASAGGLAAATSRDLTIAEPFPYAVVEAGLWHSCALAEGGRAYCWGLNPQVDSLAVAVSGGLVFAVVDAGDGFSCGATSGGAAYCWGINDRGQLGDGTTTNSGGPVAVLGGLTFSSISSGSGHACGVVSGGAAYCWGLNDEGQLGDGTTTSRSAPVLVAGGHTFARVSASGYHTCGVTTAGAAYCWGRNGGGQLGDGTTTDSRTPAAVSGGFSFSGITAGYNGTCGVTTEGAGYCWGQGALGNGALVRSSVPEQVSGGLSFAAISPGLFHTCGVTTAGAAYCWGSNSALQLGTGSAVLPDRCVDWFGFSVPCALRPVAVAGGHRFVSISAGGSHACALTADGACYCWGQNYYGQLGIGSTLWADVPVRVSRP